MTASNGQHIETALPVSMRRRLATTATDGNPNRSRRRTKAASTGRRGRRSAANTDSGAMSPSAVSSCSLASIATTSSGLSSAASNSSISSSNGSGKELPLPVVTPSESPSTDKSTSSSSAASSAGFCDTVSSAGDVDEFDLEYIDPTVNLIHFIDQTAFTDARVWVNNAPTSRGSKCKRNKRGCPSSHGNVPNLSNPAVHQFFNEQRRFYRQIYDQQFSALSSISKAKADPKSVTFETPKMVTYAPHQHLGLPPMPPPPATSAPWMYPNYQSFIAAQPLPEEASPCEEAFLARLEEHRVPTKALREVMSRSRVRDIKIPTSLDLSTPTMENTVIPNVVEASSDSVSNPDEEKTTITSEESNICSSKISDEECRAARADFHRQIRERLLGVTKPNSATSTAPTTTPVSPSPSPVTQYPVSPSPSNASVTSSYATILTKIQPPSPPQPLNRVTVSPPPHLPLSAMDGVSSVSSSSSSSVSSLTTGKSKRNHRGGKKKAANSKASTPAKEFNMGEEDFPPIGDKTLSSMLEAVVVSKAMPIPSPREKSSLTSRSLRSILAKHIATLIDDRGTLPSFVPSVIAVGRVTSISAAAGLEAVCFVCNRLPSRQNIAQSVRSSRRLFPKITNSLTSSEGERLSSKLTKRANLFGWTVSEVVGFDGRCTFGGGAEAERNNKVYFKREIVRKKTKKVFNIACASALCPTTTHPTWVIRNFLLRSARFRSFLSSRIDFTPFRYQSLSPVDPGSSTDYSYPI
uniref:PHD-type domain-containing protein n=1 Tax=Panagrellus redivivus TaxID=6233 RepID=A0A7E4V0Z9_PANRE